MPTSSTRASGYGSLEAATNYDTGSLLLVTLAGLSTASRKGSRTSQKTLDAYPLTVRDFLPWRTCNVGLRQKRGFLSAATIARYTAGMHALYLALRWAGATEAQPSTRCTCPATPRPAS